MHTKHHSTNLCNIIERKEEKKKKMYSIFFSLFFRFSALLVLFSLSKDIEVVCVKVPKTSRRIQIIVIRVLCDGAAMICKAIEINNRKIFILSYDLMVLFFIFCRRCRYYLHCHRCLLLLLAVCSLSSDDKEINVTVAKNRIVGRD